MRGSLISLRSISRTFLPVSRPPASKTFTPLTRTSEQLHTPGRFPRIAHIPADSRLSDIEAPGSPAKAALIYHRKKLLQLAKDRACSDRRAPTCPSDTPPPPVHPGEQTFLSSTVLESRC